MSARNWRKRLSVNPSRIECELAIKLQDSGVQIPAQVEVPITIVDFYFPTQPNPTLVFIDGRPHLSVAQAAKDEELRTMLRRRGYRVLELSYTSYSDKKRDEFHQTILDILGTRE